MHGTARTPLQDAGLLRGAVPLGRPGLRSTPQLSSVQHGTAEDTPGIPQHLDMARPLVRDQVTSKILLIRATAEGSAQCAYR